MDRIKIQEPFFAYLIKNDILVSLVIIDLNYIIIILIKNNIMPKIYNSYITKHIKNT